jgi:hypothetical protein
MTTGVVHEEPDTSTAAVTCRLLAVVPAVVVGNTTIGRPAMMEALWCRGW